MLKDFADQMLSYCAELLQRVLRGLKCAFLNQSFRHSIICCCLFSFTCPCKFVVVFVVVIQLMNWCRELDLPALINFTNSQPCIVTADWSSRLPVQSPSPF